MVKIEMPKYQIFKQSGVEWLGEIPNHWEVKRLKYVFKIKKEISGELGHNVLSITQKGIKIKDTESGEGQLSMDYSKYQKVSKGDFGMNHMDLLTGYVDVSKFDGVMSPDYRVFESIEMNSDKNYLLSILQLCYSRKIFYAHGQGVSMLGRWRFSTENFNNFNFPIPPKEEQFAISEFLERKTTLINQAIAIKQKQIELLKERRQILIHKAVTHGLNPNVKLKDSGVEWIGEIPEGWEVKRLKEICKAFGRIGFRGYTTSDLVDEGEGAITISPSNIKEEFMTFEKCSYLSWDKYHQSPEIQIFENDVLMVKTGSTYGKTGIVQSLKQKATINPQLLVFKAIKIEPIYFYTLLKTSMVQYQVQTEVIGSTIPTISETKILNIKVAIPSPKEMGEIISYNKNVNLKITAAISLKEQEIEKLKEYKATLINSAVTGKIKVY